ncbi:unnamed protein product [Absidia cylindrospora]
MASTKEYQYMTPTLTQTHCHKSLSGKNTVNMSPMDLDFSSAMNLNNSMDPAQTEGPYNRYHHHQDQPQRQPNSPANPHAPRHSSFQLPSFASLISGGPSHSVPYREHMTTPTTTPSPSNAMPSSMHLPRLDDYSMQLPPVPTYASLPRSSSEYSVPQPVFGVLPSTAAVAQTRPNDSSAFVSVTSNCNQEYYSSAAPHSPNIEYIPTTTTTTTSMADTSPKPASAKKGRRTRKPKFISRVLNANMQWSSNNSSKNNDAVTFRPYQYEPRRSSQQQEQHQQQQLDVGRRRISSVGTSSSSLVSSGPMSSSTTIVDPSPSSSTTPSIISNSSATMVKPRWQETERMDLLKAIVKEKQLDDMKSFSWDKISLAVGRAKKACKDQYRREVLPALMEKLK